MGDKEIRITLRIPDAIAQRVAEDATANNRSMNSEIIARLNGDGMPVDFRDYAALVALPSVVTTCASDSDILKYPSPEAYFAARAYGLADAMMIARKGGAA